MKKVFSFLESNPSSTSDVARARADIKALVHTTAIDAKGGVYFQDFSSNSMEGVENAHNVRAVLCSINDQCSPTGAITVMNVIFDKGGILHEHTHASEENIFILDGGLKCELTGQYYSAGSCIRIPPEQPHAYSSDYALLTVTWRPAFSCVLNN